jgi:hypothetical protein
MVPVQADMRKVKIDGATTKLKKLQEPVLADILP